MSNNKPRRQPAMPTHHLGQTPHTGRLLPTTTFTYLASWRGQLLICTVVLALGAVYFVIREPVAKWKRGRRETLSRARETELLNMEDQPEGSSSKSREREKEKEKEKEVQSGDPKKDERSQAALVDNAKSARERGREKRKEVKKLKGPSSRVLPGVEATDGTETTSANASKTISSDHLPSSLREEIDIPEERIEKEGESTAESSRGMSDTTHSDPTSSTETSPSNPPSILPEVSTTTKPIRNTPRSKTVNPSQNDRRSSTSSNEEKSDKAEEKVEKKVIKIEEELSIPFGVVLPVSGKKKKRKGKKADDLSIVLPHSGESKSTSSSRSKERLSPIKNDIKLLVTSPTTTTHTIHSPSSSQSDNLQAQISNQERVIDALRAEIGTAKAEEGKAKEDAKRSKNAEDQLRGDLERVRKGVSKSEIDGRRREADLQSRLANLSQAHNTVVHRLQALESLLRDLPIQLPSPQPMSAYSNSPLPSPFTYTYPSPAIPGTPQPMSMGPALPVNPMGLAGYQSPGIYSPLLHPHFSPSPFRRASGGVPPPNGVPNELAGALSPGMGPDGSGGGSPVKSEIGLPGPSYTGLSGVRQNGPGFPPTPLSLYSHTNGHSAQMNGYSNSNGNEASPNRAQAELRRLSIESSVLKKKVVRKEGSENGSSLGSEGNALTEVSEQDEVAVVEGLGMGEIKPRNDHSIVGSPEHVKVDIDHPNGDAGMTDDSPNGYAPPAEEVTGTVPYPNDFPSAFGGIRCVSTGSQGNVYIREESGSTSASMSASASVSASTPNSDIEVLEDNRHEVVEGDDGEDDSDSEIKSYEPVFPSLAHTPAQVEEMRKMRERAMRDMKRGRARGRVDDVMIAGGVGVGVGVVPLLTPAPSLSPGMKRVGLEAM